MERKLIDFFYRWDRTEKRRKIGIIDIDLLHESKHYPGTFSSRMEILRRIQRLQKEYADQPERNALIEARLKGSEYYLRALMGEIIPFDEYLQETMGIKPIFIPEDTLKKQLDLLKSAYKNVGYTWDTEGINRFERDNVLTKEEIEKSFIEFREKSVPEVLEWLGMNFNLTFNVSFVDENEFWMNWIVVGAHGRIRLLFNVNKRHIWLKGSTEFFVFHEICGHAIQANAWEQQILAGNIPKSLGLVTAFCPEQFVIEGIAESLLYFYPENPFSDFGLVSVYEDLLYWMVWSNAHIMANHHENKKKIYELIHTYLPNLKEDDIDDLIKEKTSDPFGRTHQYVYGISAYYHQLIAQKLNASEKRKYVQDIYTHGYTPSEIFHKYLRD